MGCIGWCDCSTLFSRLNCILYFRLGFTYWCTFELLRLAAKGLLRWLRFSWGDRSSTCLCLNTPRGRGLMLLQWLDWSGTLGLSPRKFIETAYFRICWCIEITRSRLISPHSIALLGLTWCSHLGLCRLNRSLHLTLSRRGSFTLLRLRVRIRLARLSISKCYCPTWRWWK